MYALGVDFETTGLDYQKNRVIEVGAVLWDTADAIPLRFQSEFSWAEDFPEIEAEAFTAHGFTKHFLSVNGSEPRTVFQHLNELARSAQCFVGHNCMSFDKPFYISECEKAQIAAIELPWIDTSCDIKYPPHIKTRSLVHLAAEHGFLNPFPHRAMFDVLTMLTIFQKYDPVAALALAQEPFVVLKACVSYDDREKAKARGYRWKDQMWLKSLRISEVEAERKDAGFLTVEVTR